MLEDGNKDIPLPKFTTYVKDITSINPIKQKPLLVRENKDNIIIDGLNEYEVDSFYDCLNLLKQGEKIRKKRQTFKNEMSSRSHTILIITVISRNSDSNGCLKVRY